MRGVPPRSLLGLAFAAVLSAPVAGRAQGFSLDATPTPVATATPAPDDDEGATDLTLDTLDATTPAPGATPVPGSTDAIPGASPVPTATPKAPQVAGAFESGLPSQYGYPGALRVVAASPGDPGLMRFTAGVEFFSEPGFIVEGKNHRRTLNTLAVDYALSRWLSTSVVVLNMANHSGATNPLYIAALGDVDASARLSVPIRDTASMRMSAGVRAGLKLMQGDGPGKGVGDAASPYVRGLASVDTSFGRFSVDAGYYVDRSAALVPEDTEPDAGQLYAYGVSEYDAVLAGASVDFPQWRVSPFGEITSRTDLGAEGDPAVIATAGVKLATASRRLAILAAYDHGLSGTELVEGRLRVPTWNVVGGFSYTFGARGPRPPRPPRSRILGSAAGDKDKDKEKGKDESGTGRITGKVVAMATRVGIPQATITIEGGPTIVTDANGAFDASGIKAGTARMVVKAPGYQERRSSSYVTEGKMTSVMLFLFAAPVAAPVVAAVPQPQPASLKGKIVSTKGKPLAATVTATYAGRTKDVKTDAKGAYKIDLQEGDYTITISSPGMKTQTYSGKLAAKEAFELDFMLAPEKKPKKNGTKSAASEKKKTN